MIHRSRHRLQYWAVGKAAACLMVEVCALQRPNPLRNISTGAFSSALPRTKRINHFGGQFVMPEGRDNVGSIR